MATQKAKSTRAKARAAPARIEIPPSTEPLEARAPEHEPDQLHRGGAWERAGAASGIVFVLLAVGAVAVVPVVPAAGDSAAEIGDYFIEHRVRILTSAYLVGGAIAAFLWFLGSLRAELRHGNDRLAAIAFGGGVAAAGLLALGAVYPAALAGGVAARGGDGTTMALFEMWGITEQMAYLPGAVFLGAASVTMIRSGVISRWLGWAGLPLALALVATAGGLYSDRGAMAQNGELGFAVLLAFLVWALAASAMLVMRPPRDSRTMPRPLGAEH